MKSQLAREWRLIRKEGWLLSITTWLPLVLFTIIWGIFSAGIARDLPIGVVDLDHSQVSRQLVRSYDANPTLAVSSVYTSVAEGSHALRGGEIYALVVIPTNLEQDTKLGKSPTATVFYNSQFVLIGKLVNSAVAQAHGTLNAQIDTLKNMASGSRVPLQALGQAVPVSNQITPLYNSNSHYGQFLVSATIPAIWQIAIVIATIIALSAEQRNAGINEWLGTEPLSNFAGKLIPYTLLFLVQGLIFLTALYGQLGWPMHGQWWILLLAQLLMVLACQGVACLFYLFTLDATKAMSLAAGFTAPAFAFVGVTFPATDMPGFALLWRALLPVTHYLDIQLHQVNHGVPALNAMPQMLCLVAFLLTLVLSAWRVGQLAKMEGGSL
ncbi:ABC transporter permease [Photobacterium rosenbergii]|uniref:ABC transporter permease n=1 Tax=Photobacterium rosenbergii TaxID=294936 RepID=A0ABU3ZDL9_9GAMM|nr:ABC transporter permease [Photobacterium rosenbergii]MDV5168013.1 ABC transporter permease [Photobacterium rosenbergii]